MTDLSLGARAGLPPHLQVLVTAHPRDRWEAHPHFNGLTRFWLDRHLLFRKMLAHLTERAELFLSQDADPRATAVDLSRVGQMFLQNLHGHHQIEDHQYFPIFARFDSRLDAAFTLLDADHHALDAVLAEFSETANAALVALTEASDASAAMGAFHGHLGQTEQLLNRHLLDEEDIIVPIILEYDPQELRH